MIFRGLFLHKSLCVSMVLRLNDDVYGQQHFSVHILKDFPPWGKFKGKKEIPCSMCWKEVAWTSPWSTEVHTPLTKASFPIESGTFFHGLTTALPLCTSFGSQSVNGKKCNGKSTLQRNLRTSAALGLSVYLTSLIQSHENTIL